LFIVNPLHGQGADNLFSTHPATQNRIERLLAMEGGGAETTPPESYMPTATVRRSTIPNSNHRSPWS
jgi:heat shock protein HtpX